jgi:hypothetical protein
MNFLVNLSLTEPSLPGTSVLPSPGAVLSAWVRLLYRLLVALGLGFTKPGDPLRESS